MTERAVLHGTFTIERRFKASRQQVFNAFADQNAKAQWFTGPPDWDSQPGVFDFRVGGIETNIGGPKGGWTSKFVCRYHDITPGERIVYVYDMFIDETPMSTSLAIIELRPDGAGTHLVMTESAAYYDQFATRESLLGREHGTNALFDALAASLGG